MLQACKLLRKRPFKKKKKQKKKPKTISRDPKETPHCRHGDSKAKLLLLDKLLDKNSQRVAGNQLATNCNVHQRRGYSGKLYAHQRHAYSGNVYFVRHACVHNQNPRRVCMHVCLLDLKPVHGRRTQRPEINTAASIHGD